MKIRLSIIGLICFFIMACGLPMAKEVRLYSSPPDSVYTQIILILQEMGWTIKSVDKASGLILAETKTFDKNSFVSSNLIHPIQGSFLIKEGDGKTSLSISITQPGEILKSSGPKILIDKILKTLEEKLK